MNLTPMNQHPEHGDAAEGRDTAMASARPQVPANSYSFQRYMSKARWNSLWHQASMIAELGPQSVIEVGAGNGLLKTICRGMSINFRTVDIDPELAPDLLGGIDAIPIPSKSVDLACAFQVLEHMPYEQSIKGFRELCRVSTKNVLLSLPNATRCYPQLVSVPVLGSIKWTLPGPSKPTTELIRSHFWEIGRPGTELDRVVYDLSKEARLEKSFRVFENPYHHFFQFRPR